MNTTSTSHISRYQIDTNSGIQTIRYERHVVGYVEQGTKLIHLGDRYVTVRSGELFHLNPGTHYIENDPAGHDLPFRQTLLFYSPSDLRNDFIPATQIAATNHLCSTCRNTTDIYTYPAWPLIESYFRSLNRLLTTRLHRQRPELSRLKICELFQLLQTQPGCCISRPMCQALSQSQRTFSDVMHANIFTTASVATLAAQCEMSPTAFKNHCQRTFGTTPHRWIVAAASASPPSPTAGVTKKPASDPPPETRKTLPLPHTQTTIHYVKHQTSRSPQRPDQRRTMVRLPLPLDVPRRLRERL